MIHIKTIEDDTDQTLYWIPLPRTGCGICISRKELMQNLPGDVLAACLKRGKYISRAKQFREREKKRNSRIQ